MQWKELEQRPFGLRAFDNAERWPAHAQADGTYRNMQELASFPLNEADVFYFVDGSVGDMVRISCSRGAVRCEMNTALGGFDGTIFFNQQDLKDWNEIRSNVAHPIERYTIASNSSASGPRANYLFNPDPQRVACMREMLPISGTDGQLPTLDVSKPQPPHVNGVQELQVHVE
jgi:hypothetical protein